jgi:hypothetical protein
MNDTAEKMETMSTKSMNSFVIGCFRCGVKIEVAAGGPLRLQVDKKHRPLIDGRRPICPKCEKILQAFNNPTLSKCIVFVEAIENKANDATNDARS